MSWLILGCYVLGAIVVTGRLWLDPSRSAAGTLAPWPARHRRRSAPRWRRGGLPRSSR